MRECLALLALIWLLRPVIGQFNANGNGRTVILPKKTPGMTDEEYHRQLGKAFGISSGIIYSMRGPDGRTISGGLQDSVPSSPYGSPGNRVSPSYPPTGYGYTGPVTYGSPSTGRSLTIPPPDPYFGFFGDYKGRTSGTAYNQPKPTSFADPNPSRFTNLRPTEPEPPVRSEYSNNGYDRGGRQSSDYYSYPRTTSIKQTPTMYTSPQNGNYQPPPPSTPKTSSDPIYGGQRSSYSSQTDEPSSQTANRYGDKPFKSSFLSSIEEYFGSRKQKKPPSTKPVFDLEPPRPVDNRYGSNPITSAIGNQGGLSKRGSQETEDKEGSPLGRQQQKTPPTSTPVTDPKVGAQAAEKLAFAIVDELRYVWNTERRLKGTVELMMELCEKAVAKQLPSMKEMKRSDKTLMDILEIWKEKIAVHIENFYQVEVRDKTVTRRSPGMATLLTVFGECVRPRLVLMKV